MTVKETFDGPLDPAWIVDVPAGSTGSVAVDSGTLLLATPRSNPMSPTERGLAPLVRRDVPIDGSPDWEVTTRITQGGSDRGMAGIGVYDVEAGTVRLQVEYQGRSSFRLLADGITIANVVKSSLNAYQLRAHPRQPLGFLQRLLSPDGC